MSTEVVNNLPKLIDIGSNLGDSVFKGSYHGKQSHPNDFDKILSRARSASIGIQLLTGDCFEGSQQVLNIAKRYNGLYSTVGCHPCRANEMMIMSNNNNNVEEYISKLSDLISLNRDKVLAIGECGLDYDRLFLSSKRDQLISFPPQLELAHKFNLPLFLHSRNCHEDFIKILRNHVNNRKNSDSESKLIRGVVHSFTGTESEALELISEFGLFIGINGCSLKTEESLSLVSNLPLSSIMIESDCPWCEIRPSHASHKYLVDLPQELRNLYMVKQNKKEKFKEGEGVKGRNEPISTGLVAWVISRLKGISLEKVAKVTTENALNLFGLKQEDGVWNKVSQIETVGVEPKVDQ